MAQRVELTAQLTSKFDSSGFDQIDARIESLDRSLSTLDSRQIQPELGFSGLDNFDRDLELREARLDAFEDRVASPSLELDVDKFNARIEGAEDRLDSFDERSVSAEARLLTGQFDAQMEGIETDLDRLDGRVAQADARLNTTAFDVDSARLETSLDRFDGRSINMEARVDTRDAESRLSAFEGFVGGLGSRISALRPNMTVGADTREAESRIGAFEGFVGGVASRISALRPNVNVGAETREAESRLGGFEGFVGGVASRISALRPTLVARGDTREAEATFSGFAGFVRGIAEQISSLRPTLIASADTRDAEARVGAFESYVRGVAQRISTLRASFIVEAVTSRAMSAVGELADFMGSVASRISALRPTMIARANTQQAEASFAGLESFVRGVAARISALRPMLIVGANTGDVEARFGALQGFISGVASRISGLRPVMVVTANTGQAESRVSDFMGFVQSTAARIASLRPTLNIDADAGVATAKVGAFSTFVEAAARRIGALRARISVDFDRRGVDQASTALGILGARMEGIPIAARLVASALPLIVTAVAAVPGVAAAAGAGLVGLTNGLVRASAGAGALGAAFLGGVGGIKAYIGLAGQAAKASQDGSLATTRWAGESNRFNTALATLKDQFTLLTREIGGGTLPIMSRFLETGISLLPRLAAPMKTLVSFMDRAGQAFLRAATSQAQLRILDTVLIRLAISTERVATIAGDAGLAFLNMFAAGQRSGNNLLHTISQLVQRFRAWTQTTQGQARMTAIFERGERALRLLGQSAVNVVRAFVQIGQAIDRSGLSTSLTNGLARAAANFQRATASGTRLNAAITSMGRLAGPVLRELGRLGVDVVRTFFEIADATLRVRAGAGRLTVMQDIIRSVRDALPAVRDLLVAAFVNIGPQIAPLIRNLAGLTPVFIGITRVTGQLLGVVNRVLDFFNRLPGPIKEAAGMVLGFAGAFAAVRLALGIINTLTGGLLRTFARIGARVALFVARFALIGALTTPVGLVITAVALLATGLILAYRRSETFRNGVQRILQRFRDFATRLRSAGQSVRDFASRMGSGIASAARTVVSGIQRILQRFRDFGTRLRSAGQAVRDFASRVVAGIRSLPGRIGGFLRQIPARIRSAFNTARTAATSAVRNLVATVLRFFSSLPGRVGSAIGRLAARVRSGLARLPGVAGRALGRLLGTVVGTFVRMGTQSGGALARFSARVLSYFASLPGRVLGALGRLGATVGQFFASLPGRIGGALVAFVTAVVTRFNSLRDRGGASIRELVSNAISFLASLPQRAASAVVAFGQAVLNGFLRARDWAVQTVTTLVQNAASWLASLPQRAASGLAAFGSAVLNGFVRARDWAVSTATDLVQRAIAFLASLPVRAASAVASFGQAVLNGFLRAREWATSTTNDLVERAIAFLASLPVRAANGIAAFGSTVLNGFVRARDGATESVGGLVSDVVSWFASLPGKVVGAIGEFTSGVIEGFMEAYNEVVGNSIVPDLVNGVVDWFASLPGKAIAFVGELVSGVISQFTDLAARAKEIIGGMADGVIDAFKRAKSAVLDNSPVPDLVRGVSRYFAQMRDDTVSKGAAIEKALIDPFKRGSDRAQESVRGLVNATRNLPLPGVGVPAMAGVIPDVGRTPLVEARPDDPLKPLADNSERHLDRLTKRTEDAGRTIQDALTRSLVQTSSFSLKALDDLDKTGTRSLANFSDDGSRSLEMLSKSGIRSSDELRDKTVSQTMDMVGRNIRLISDMQSQGSQEFATLQDNGTNESAVLRRNSVASVNAMHRSNVATMKDMQDQGTQQFTVLQREGTSQTDMLRSNATMAITDTQVEGTRQFTILQQEGTSQSEMLRSNAVTAMNSAQSGMVSALTATQAQGNEQLSALRSGGSATMQAADPEWRGPVGAAARGVQNYLNDMLYGMAQVIDAASLSITAPSEFTPRLTGAARGGMLGMPKVRGFAGGGLTDRGGSTFTPGDAHSFSSMNDDARFAQSANRPAAPAGHSYAEDLTIVPDSFYGGGGSGGGGGASGGSGSMSAPVGLSFAMGFAKGGMSKLRGFAHGGTPLGSMDMGDEYVLGPNENVKDPGLAHQLYDSGYRGNPGDAQEALYAPGSAMNPVFGPGSMTPGSGGPGSWAAPVGLSFAMGFAEGGEGEPADWGALMAFLKQGKVRWDDGRGGVAGPGESFLHWWGEGENANATEYYIVDGREENLPVLEAAARSLGRVVHPITDEDEREHGHGHPALRGHALGGISGLPTLRGFAHGYTQYEDLWTPRTAQIARQTEAATGAAPNTYSTHPDGYEERAPYSIDWWGPGGRGDAISVAMGDAVQSYVQANFASELSYWIWNYMDSLGGSIAATDPHDDHYHGTFMPGLNLGGAGGAPGPNIAPLIEKFFPTAMNFGTSIPEQVATEIGEDAREALIAELMKFARRSGGPGGGFSGGGDPAANRALGQQMNEAMGWGSMWPSLDALWSAESGWDHLVSNMQGSGAYGIPQALPGNKMAASGADWETNPATQIDWGLGYIGGRYGDPASAWSAHQAQSWYTNGGIATKPQMASVAENGPEFFMPLHDPSSARRFLDFIEDAAVGGTRRNAQPERDQRVDNVTQPVSGGPSPAVRSQGVQRVVDRTNEPIQDRQNSLVIPAGTRHTDVASGQNEVIKISGSNQQILKKITELNDRSMKDLRDTLKSGLGAVKTDNGKQTVAIQGSLGSGFNKTSKSVQDASEGTNRITITRSKDIRSGIDLMRDRVENSNRTSERVGNMLVNKQSEVIGAIKPVAGKVAAGTAATSDLLAVTRRVWGLADGGKITGPTPAVLGERAASGETEYVMSDAPRVRQKTIGLLSELTESIGYTLLDERGRPKNAGTHRMIHGGEDHRHAVAAAGGGGGGGGATLPWNLVNGKVIRYKNNSVYKQDIATAFNRWNEIGGAYLLPHYGNSPDMTISDRHGSGWIGLTGSAGYMYLDPDVMGPGGNPARTLTGHEAGHAFGIDHIPGTVMNSTVNTSGGNVEYPGGAALSTFINMWGSGGGKPKVPSFHQGGIVPGVGDKLIVAEGGEEVTSKEMVHSRHLERTQGKDQSSHALREIKEALVKEFRQQTREIRDSVEKETRLDKYTLELLHLLNRDGAASYLSSPEGKATLGRIIEDIDDAKSLGGR